MVTQNQNHITKDYGLVVFATKVTSEEVNLRVWTSLPHMSVTLCASPKVHQFYLNSPLVTRSRAVSNCRVRSIAWKLSCSWKGPDEGPWSSDRFIESDNSTSSYLNQQLSTAQNVNFFLSFFFFCIFLGKNFSPSTDPVGHLLLWYEVSMQPNKDDIASNVKKSLIVHEQILLVQSSLPLKDDALLNLSAWRNRSEIKHAGMTFLFLVDKSISETN